MIINLTDVIGYDTSILFEEQSQECIDFVNTYISNNTPSYNWDEIENFNFITF